MQVKSRTLPMVTDLIWRAPMTRTSFYATRVIAPLFAVLGCRGPSSISPEACNRDVQVVVVTGANPVFSWSPACGVSSLSVVTVPSTPGANQESVWGFSVPEQNPIGPAIRFRSVRALGFSPDGASVLTGGGQVPGYGGPAYMSFKAGQLWDASIGKPTGPPLAHEGWVQAAAFSPDGSRLLTGSHDKSARLWKVPHFVEGDVERLVVWVQLDTDTALDEHGQARRLDNEGRDKRRKRLQELGGPPRIW